MEKQIAIFTVFVWKKVDGKRGLNVHYVAGLDSADAERRIKQSDRLHLRGDAFITTDEHNALAHNPAVRMYTTRMTNEDDVSDTDFNRWLSMMTRPHYPEDGERVPQAVRLI